MSQSKRPGEVRCARCQSVVMAGTRFCSQCGMAMAIPSAEPLPPPLPGRGNGVPPLQGGLGQTQSAPRPPVQVPPTHSSPGPAQQGSGVMTVSGPTGRAHWPVVAAVGGVILPGGGQAYNGKVFRAFLIALIGMALAAWAATYGPVVSLPAILAVGWQAGMALLAWVAARRIVQRGGRMAKGGLLWIFLQFWLVANLILAVLIGLTLKGVLV